MREWRLPGAVESTSDPHVLEQSSDCPKCVQSRAMKIVTAEFERRGIEVEYEWRQKWCGYKLTLPADYFVPLLKLSDARTLGNFVKEIDGVQNFGLFPRHDFAKQFRRDMHKIQCVIEHDIPMIRILRCANADNKSTWFARFEKACDIFIETRKRKAILLEDNKLYRNWHDEHFDDSLKPYVLWF